MTITPSVCRFSLVSLATMMLAVACSTATTTQSSNPNDATAGDGGADSATAGRGGATNRNAGGVTNHAGSTTVGGGVGGGVGGATNQAGSPAVAGATLGTSGSTAGVAIAGTAGINALVGSAGIGAGAAGTGIGGSAGAGTNADAAGAPPANSGGSVGSGAIAGFAGTDATAGRPSNTAGASATFGGAAGAVSVVACNTSADCASLNPDPYSCRARCQAGTCTVDVDSDLVLAKLTDHELPITGVWDAENRPYIIRALFKQADANASIEVQRMRADGMKNGTPSVYVLPGGVQNLDHIAAVLRGTTLGLMWNAQIHLTNSGYYATQFVETSLAAGTDNAPVTLMYSTTATPYPEVVDQLLLAPSTSNQWVFGQFGGFPMRWQGYVGAASSAASVFPVASVSDGPLYYDAKSAVLGSTLLLTGHDCSSFRTSSCFPQLVVARYSVADFSSLGGSIQLSTFSFDMNVTRVSYFEPALGAVGDKMAIFWNEESTEGLLLGRALLSEAGSYVQVPRTAATTLMPQAVSASTDGGGILFATRRDSATGWYELIAQKFDSTLNFVGSPSVLSAANAIMPAQVTAHPSSDGRVLVTFRHGNAKFSIVHSGLCR